MGQTQNTDAFASNLAADRHSWDQIQSGYLNLSKNSHYYKIATTV